MTNSPLSPDNTAFFSAADNSLFKDALSALLSIKKSLPNAKLFLLSRDFSPKQQKILQVNHIKFIRLDLTYLFFQTFTYPIEDFYFFAGPTIFFKLNFKYSVYIHPSSRCQQNPLLDIPDFPQLAGFHQTPKSPLNDQIVYFNNKNLQQSHFLENAGQLFYNHWQPGNPYSSPTPLFIDCQKSLTSTTLPTELFQTTWSIAPRTPSPTPNKLYKIFKKLHKLPLQAAFVIKGLRKPILIKRQNFLKPPIKLYWWQPHHLNNFGDIVSPDLILNLFGRRTDWAPIETCELMATGSIIEIAEEAKTSHSFFAWGSGFIRPDSGENNLSNITFTAVRGEKTKARLHIAVPTGDPGLLINAAYCLKKKRRSKKIGVVIHYADLPTPIAKKICEDPRFTVINPLNSSENVARQIADCGLILSSSLHGLIFADSLGVPNAHIKLSNNLTGGLYKFYDYYSGINKPYHPADIHKIFDDAYLKQLKKTHQPVPRLAKKQRTLIKAFPFK